MSILSIVDMSILFLRTLGYTSNNKVVHFVQGYLCLMNVTNTRQETKQAMKLYKQSTFTLVQANPSLSRYNE